MASLQRHNSHSRQLSFDATKPKRELPLTSWSWASLSLTYILGPSGSGKTTFINTLCENEVLPLRDFSNPELAAAERTVSITSHQVGTCIVKSLKKRIGRGRRTIDIDGFGYTWIRRQYQ